MLVLVMALGLFAGCEKKAEPKVDTSWYKDSATTFTLKKANQLMGLAELAKTKNFEGKTIKLGANIKLNDYSEAILAKWQLGTVVPENAWTPLGNADLPFAGNFDGQGYTISGLYVSGAEDGTGFIGIAAKGIEFKNVKFVDGYIKNTKNSTGLIGSGTNCITVENVYTNLLVESYGNFVGGIIGYYKGGYSAVADGDAANWVDGHVKFINCWFDGTLSTGGYAIGGIVGGQDARSKCEIYNCLSTGTIKSLLEEGNHCRAGAIFGWLNWSAKYFLTNCVAAATIETGYKGSDVMAGALIGDIGASGLTISNCYGVGKTVIGRDQKGYGLDDDGILKTLDEIKALDITTALPKMEGETASPWEAVAGSTPVLKNLK